MKGFRFGKDKIIVLMRYRKNRSAGKSKRRYIAAGIAGAVCLFFLTSCGRQETVEEKPEETGFVAAQTGAYDSADTAVVAEIDRNGKSVTLKNMDIKRQYTLTYDGTTFFYDKYGTVISDAQLQKGEIVDVTFLKERKRLNSLQVSKEAWSHRNIDEYELDEENFRAEVGSAVYAYSEDTVVVADGKQAELIDISPVDILTFRGIGSDVYSIVVEKGHGYVRLKNEEYFYNGWIEIGNKIIKKVSENMMLTVPEGSHQVIISNKGTSGVKQIEVRKDTELELDVGDLKGEEPKYGSVVFTITPKEASLYLDGEKTDYSAPVRLEYGIHQMIVMAEGYHTISQYLKVGQASAGIEVAMEAREGVSGNDVSGNNALSDSEMLAKVNKLLEERGYSGITADDLAGNRDSAGNSGTGQNQTENSGTGQNQTENNGTGTEGGQGTSNTPVTSTLSYYVTIDAPVGVEIYLDGNYIGITPCSFKKTPGSHTLTLRNTGYVAKSYTIQVDDEEKNVSYSFLDLVKIE